MTPSLGLAYDLRHFALLQVPGLPEARIRANHFAQLHRIYDDWTAPSSTIHEGELAEIKACFAEPGVLEAALGYYRAMKRVPFDRELGAWLKAKITVPTMVIAGEQDFASLRRVFGDVARHIDAPSRLVWIPDAAHFMLLENPEPTYDAVLEWLSAP